MSTTPSQLGRTSIEAHVALHQPFLNMVSFEQLEETVENSRNSTSETQDVVEDAEETHKDSGDDEWMELMGRDLIMKVRNRVNVACSDVIKSVS